MQILSIDIETFSDVDLIKSGVYAYTASPHFEILLFAYAFGDGEIKIIDLASGEKLTDEIISAVIGERIIKTAFNANFERICLSRYLGKKLSPDSWQCTAVQAATLGLPLSLEGVAQVLGLAEQKMKEGKDLIRYFSIPCKPTKINEGRTRNFPCHSAEKWTEFKNYCKRDVEVERAIRKRIARYPINENEQENYIIDQQINDRGVLVDLELVAKAMECDRLHKDDTFSKAQRLTGLENPNSVVQLKQWLFENGVEMDSLSKKAVTDLVKESDGEVEKLLNLRLQLAKTSVKKYEAIERSVCPDERVRGLFQFYGANRTGRFAGRLVQVQNLPQNHLIDLDLARKLLKSGHFDTLELLFESVPHVLSELIRTSFVPKPNSRFIVADFSAIEARVIAWIAGEKWRMDVFKTHGKIYEASASQMFKVPIEEITKTSPLRQKGKVAELACIAEEELVLTDKGLVEIQDVTIEHKLWDGKSWVSHDGVIYRGEKEVIEYEGLRATADHIVWVEEQSKPVFFRDATTSGAHLLQTGNGRKAIRLGKNNKFRETMECQYESLLCSNAMCKLQKHPVDILWKFKKRLIKRMSELFTTKADTEMVRQEINCCKAKMRKFKGCKLQQLRRTWNRIQIQFNNRSWNMDSSKCRKRIEKFRNGSYRFKWTLRKRQYSICSKKCKPNQQEEYNSIGVESITMAIFKNCYKQNACVRNEKRRNNCTGSACCKTTQKKLEINRSKVRVYDILNAGKNNRFTVSGKLVHNCGYGGGVGALKAMGALDMGVAEEDLNMLIQNWRQSNPKITKLWWDIDKAAVTAVKEKTSQVVGKIKIQYESGIMFISLPSGRRLSYIKPRIEPNRFDRDAVTYEGIGTTKKWERIETYGPKLVENIVQATARDLLVEAMKAIAEKGYEIVMHCHDEVIIEAPYGFGSLKEVSEIMAIAPAWAEGLPLRADGYECNYYKKD